MGVAEIILPWAKCRLCMKTAHMIAARVVGATLAFAISGQKKDEIERAAPTEEDMDKVRECSHHVKKFLEGLGDDRLQVLFGFEKLFSADGQGLCQGSM